MEDDVNGKDITFHVGRLSNPCFSPLNLNAEYVPFESNLRVVHRNTMKQACAEHMFEHHRFSADLSGVSLSV